MFENVLGQPATNLLCEAIKRNNLAPALLFIGPDASAKLTTALETARVLSCEGDGSWTCMCDSCKRHKDLAAADILIMGTRDTVLETKAAARVLCTHKTPAARYLFARAVRKLTSRFDARLWDTDESRFLKAAPILAELDEELFGLLEYYDQITAWSAEDEKKLEKQTGKIIDLCGKLQDECLYDSLPVNQVRKASAWVRLMPTGKKKVLIVENADRMQEAARNAFLKILEEPPEYAVFILTTTRRAAIIPTILSRVRPYTFTEREAVHQQAVIERVFRDISFCASLPADQQPRIMTYLRSFLPVSAGQLKEAAALLWGYCVQRMERENRPPLPVLTEMLNSGFGGVSSVEPSLAAVLKLIHNGKPHCVYTLFLESVISFLQAALHTGSCSIEELEHYAAFSRFIQAAIQSVDVFNSSPQAALETLVEAIVTSMEN